MESMIAVMVIIITLTAFLSFLSFSMAYVPEKGIDVPLDVLDDVSIVNGKIESDAEEKMLISMERYGFKGMRVILSVADTTYNSTLTLNLGSNDSDIITTKSGTIIVRSDDGRSVPVNYTVAVWS